MFRCNHHHQGAHFLSLLNLQLIKQSIKYNGVVNLVVWLHPHHQFNHTSVF
jgi:hypothetical protein